MGSILVYSAIAFFAFVDQASANYSADLRCGKCIKEGYNFCFVGTDTETFDRDNKPETTCC